jgi:simple sugar transport system permease protein
MEISDIFTVAFLVTWLSAAIRLAIPVLLAALGEIVNELAGICNVGIEGLMLLGALGGFLGSFYSQSPMVGILIGVLVGCIGGTFLAWMYVYVQGDQMVVGIVFNIFAAGFTSFTNRAALGITVLPAQAPMFKALKIPFLSDIPVLGPILFEHNIFVYIIILMVFVLGIVIYRTKLGLAIRAAGEHPRAADTAGINVNRTRFLVMVFAGGLAGFAGALLVLGQLGIFRDNVTAGRGFIALAIVIFGRWNPYVALISALIFGAADSLAMSLQIFPIPIPEQFLIMLPYIVTFIVMSGISGKVIGPANLMKPYSRE